MVKRRFLALLVMVFMVAGCGIFGNVKNLKLSEMTSEQKAVWMNEVYAAQYDDYKAMVVLPGLTNAQKQVMRIKKKIFIEVWPLMNLYSGYVATGVIPTAELESRIINLLNQLMSKGGI